MATNFKDYLGSKDVKWWNGVVRLFSRRISTGASIEMNMLGNCVDVVEAYGSGTDRSDVALLAALASIGSNKCIFVLQPGAWAVDNNVTLPATVSLLVPHGAEITIGAAATLTVNGPVIAGPYEIFKGTGTLAGSPLLQIWDPTWINAAVTDSTTKSYKALTLGNTSVGTLASGNQTVTGNVTVSGTVTATTALSTDTISERTAAAGVTIDGMQIKDSQPYCDVINEKSAATGVTIDGVLCKDGQITATVFNLLPAGVVMMYGAASAPTGWLLCDGSQVSRTTYAALYAVIGDTFGAGDGVTTFNVPNMNGRSPVGVGQGNTAEGGGLGTDRVLAATGGAETHTLVTGELAAHTHTTGDSVLLGAGAAGALANSGTGNSSGSTGSGTAHNNMAPFLAVNFIIKT